MGQQRKRSQRVRTAPQLGHRRTGQGYVTARDNQRIQVFDSNGKILSQWTGTGGISGLGITKDQRIWTGGILRDLEGKVLGRLPGTTGGHGVAVTDSGDVYIAQLGGEVQKFVKLWYPAVEFTHVGAVLRCERTPSWKHDLWGTPQFLKLHCQRAMWFQRANVRLTSFS